VNMSDEQFEHGPQTIAWTCGAAALTVIIVVMLLAVSSWLLWLAPETTGMLP